MGRGISIGLAGCGFDVFATGRSIHDALLPDGVHRLPCDHTKTDETYAVFDEIAKRAGTLDLW